jgi:hypothetical protein
VGLDASVVDGKIYSVRRRRGRHGAADGKVKKVLAERNMAAPSRDAAYLRTGALFMNNRNQLIAPSANARRQMTAAAAPALRYRRRGERWQPS